MLCVFCRWRRQITKDNWYEKHGDRIRCHYVDRSNQSELKKYFSFRETKNGKANGCGNIRKKKRDADLFHHSCKCKSLTFMAGKFYVVFIQQENAVRYANDDKERRNKSDQAGYLIS